MLPREDDSLAKSLRTRKGYAERWRTREWMDVLGGENSIYLSTKAR